MTPSGIEPATCRFVAKCLFYQIRDEIPIIQHLKSRTRAAGVIFPQSPLVSSDETNAKTCLKSGPVVQQHVEAG
jgi:hypothetical protein